MVERCSSFFVGSNADALNSPKTMAERNFLPCATSYMDPSDTLTLVASYEIESLGCSVVVPVTCRTNLPCYRKSCCGIWAVSS